jgi:NADH:ubiquinone oxidoreductase subunit B-like Fe-S oxidoreductase
MIDFSTSQLTWIVVGACSLGGGGYLTMTSTVGELDKKIEVSNARAEAMNEKLSSLQQQLDRIEHKIDSSRK